MEYATRDQAQQAIQTLSNQSLMGRLVYVREVWIFDSAAFLNSRMTTTNFELFLQDRETEPRFTGPPGGRGDFGGGQRGGANFNTGYGGGGGGGMGGDGGGRQLYVSNVCALSSLLCLAPRDSIDILMAAPLQRRMAGSQGFVP